LEAALPTESGAPLSQSPYFCRSHISVYTEWREKPLGSRFNTRKKAV